MDEIRQDSELSTEQTNQSECELANSIADKILAGKSEEEVKTEVQTETGITPITSEEYIANHKTELTENDTTLYPKPKKSCKYCHGRGYEGFFLDGTVKLCRRISNGFSKYVFDKNNLMTYGELKNILSTVAPHRRPKLLSRKRYKRITNALKKGILLKGRKNELNNYTDVGAYIYSSDYSTNFTKKTNNNLRGNSISNTGEILTTTGIETN